MKGTNGYDRVMLISNVVERKDCEIKEVIGIDRQGSDSVVMEIRRRMVIMTEFQAIPKLLRLSKTSLVYVLNSKYRERTLVFK